MRNLKEQSLVARKKWNIKEQDTGTGSLEEYQDVRQAFLNFLVKKLRKGKKIQNPVLVWEENLENELEKII